MAQALVPTLSMALVFPSARTKSGHETAARRNPKAQNGPSWILRRFGKQTLRSRGTVHRLGFRDDVPVPDQHEIVHDIEAPVGGLHERQNVGGRHPLSFRSAARQGSRLGRPTRTGRLDAGQDQEQSRNGFHIVSQLIAESRAIVPRENGKTLPS